ncbi:DNA-directed RNA polymerase III subunit RPC7-like isoform X2 [Patagioenas fasciata]|uniref:DNA-directed RNA polymerase III subunit RPC7-like isoform X2 n=1 Tax=Patagioenas fasciata TaxID=372321 RepID=UPI003A98DCA3
MPQSGGAGGYGATPAPPSFPPSPSLPTAPRYRPPAPFTHSLTHSFLRSASRPAPSAVIGSAACTSCVLRPLRAARIPDARGAAAQARTRAPPLPPPAPQRPRPRHGGPRPGPGADDVQHGGRWHREGGRAAPPHAPALPAVPAPGAPRRAPAGGGGGRVHAGAEAGAAGGHEKPPVFRQTGGAPERYRALLRQVPALQPRRQRHRLEPGLEAAAAGAEDPGAAAAERPKHHPHPQGQAARGARQGGGH